MNCRRVSNLMSAYVDGELTGAEMFEIRRHLSDCPDCAEEHEAVQSIKLAVMRLGNVQPRKEFTTSLFARLDEVRVPRYQRAINSLLHFAHQRLSPVAAAVAASALALVVMSAGGLDRLPSSGNQMASLNNYSVAQMNASRQMTGHIGYEVLPAQQPLRLADDPWTISNSKLDLVTVSDAR